MCYPQGKFGPRGDLGVHTGGDFTVTDSQVLNEETIYRQPGIFRCRVPRLGREVVPTGRFIIRKGRS